MGVGGEIFVASEEGISRRKNKNKQTTDVRILVSALGNGFVCYNGDVHLTVGYEHSITVPRNDNSVTLKSVRRTLPY